MRPPIAEHAIRTPRDLAPLPRPHAARARRDAGGPRAALRRGARARARRGLPAPRRGPRGAAAPRGSAVRVVAVVDFPRGEGGDRRARAARRSRRSGSAPTSSTSSRRCPSLLAGRWEAVLEDLRAVVRAVAGPGEGHPRDARLSRDQKVAAAALARCAGAAFVKTSTGFGGRRRDGRGRGPPARGGRRRRGREGVRRASGPPPTRCAMIRAGASRIGASACVAIVTGAF